MTPASVHTSVDITAYLTDYLQAHSPYPLGLRFESADPVQARAVTLDIDLAPVPARTPPPPPSTPSQLILTATTDDAYILDHDPGGLDSPWDGPGIYLHSQAPWFSTFQVDATHKGLLDFDLSGVQGGEVSQAVLTLSGTIGAPPTAPISVVWYKGNGSFSIGDFSATAAPAATLTPVPGAAAAPPDSYQLDVTAAVPVPRFEFGDRHGLPPRIERRRPDALERVRDDPDRGRHEHE